MRCDQLKNRFVPAVKYGSRVRLRTDRCKRVATKRARVPFGTGFVDREMCARCAEVRAASVLATRGKVVIIKPLDSDA
jgi:hypothetical protein